MKKIIKIEFLLIFLIKEIFLINWNNYKSYTILELSNNGIISIKGIEILTKLRTLNLGNNQIVQIQSLEFLENLTNNVYNNKKNNSISYYLFLICETIFIFNYFICCI
jgi:Leucine-rich repeat (LRR) protein